MRILVISRSLATLNPSDAVTSSQTYELGLARALSAGAEVTVVSLSGRKSYATEHLSLIGLGAGLRGLRPMAALLRLLLKRSIRGSYVLAFGYDPALLAVLTLVRVNGCVVCPIIFDSHRGSLAARGKTRATLIGWYFALGWRMLRLTHGAIVVTDAAREAVERLNSRVLLSRVATDSYDEHRWRQSANGAFKIAYAGALEEYNSIAEILEAFEKLSLELHEYSLHLFGTGSLRSEVEIAAARNSSIVFHGQTNQQIVWATLGTADVALNIRSVQHAVSEFAFPSKLVELWGAGVPVISTPVLAPEVIERYGILVKEVTAEKIALAIAQAREDNRELTVRAASAPSFIRRHYSWPVIGAEISSFLRELA